MLHNLFYIIWTSGNVFISPACLSCRHLSDLLDTAHLTMSFLFYWKYYKIELPKMLLRCALSNGGRWVCWGSRRLTLETRPPRSSAAVGRTNIGRLYWRPFRQQSGFRLSILQIQIIFIPNYLWPIFYLLTSGVWAFLHQHRSFLEGAHRCTGTAPY